MLENIYEKLALEYEKKRDAAQHQAENRLKKVYALSPEIEAVDNALSTSGIRYMKEYRLAKDKKQALENYKKEISDLNQKRADLLSQLGLPADHTEVKYECPLCSDTGFTEGVSCKCRNKRLTDYYYDISNLKNTLKQQSFKTFDINIFSNEKTDPDSPTPRENMEKIRYKVIEAIGVADRVPMNFLFYGNSGTGKTFLCSCIAGEFINMEKSVVCLSAYDITEIMLSYRFNKDETDYSQTQIRLMKECDLLIIDDLGTESTNSAANSELFNIINSRLNSEKSTIISTNLSAGDIMERYSERIASRILGLYKAHKFIGNDIRLHGRA